MALPAGGILGNVFLVAADYVSRRLLASLGADTAIALRRHAAQHDWTLGRITVGLRWSRAAAGEEHIERRLSFGRVLTAEQKSRLLEVAEATPVSSVVRAGIAVHSSVVD